MSPMTIWGLPLPAALVDWIRRGRWGNEFDQGQVDDLFPDNAGLTLYTPAMMEEETRGCRNPEFQTPMWIGRADAAAWPGDVDPLKTLLIADLGLGTDQPIVLDYRASLERPRVLTLRWSTGGVENRWVEIAPDIEAFARKIDLRIE